MPKKKISIILKPLHYSILPIILLVNCGLAQGRVITNNTFPLKTTLNRSDDFIQVTGGTKRGKNTFHGFSKFNIKRNETFLLSDANSDYISHSQNAQSGKQKTTDETSEVK